MHRKDETKGPFKTNKEGCGIMSRYVAWMSILVLILGAHQAWAIGTLAGTDITNQAIATYTIGTTELTVPSNLVTIQVVELLSVSTVWQDAANVAVNPGDNDQVLTFLVTNIGNGNDTFTLSALNNGLPGDQFDPTLVDLYLDSNGNGIYDQFIDEQYIPGGNDPDLDPDGSVIVFALNNIPVEEPPGQPLIDGDLGHCNLTAASNTGTGPPGTVVPGAGDNGSDAVIGQAGGDDDDTGTYVVSGVLVTVTKSAVVTDPWNGDTPVPGAVIAYTLVVVVSGAGTAEDVVITDEIPTYTTYNPGTVTLDSVSLTDASDADAGQYTLGPPPSIAVALGDLTSASPQHTISFDVTID